MCACVNGIYAGLHNVWVEMSDLILYGFGEPGGVMKLNEFQKYGVKRTCTIVSSYCGVVQNIIRWHGVHFTEILPKMI